MNASSIVQKSMNYLRSCLLKETIYGYSDIDYEDALKMAISLAYAEGRKDAAQEIFKQFDEEYKYMKDGINYYKVLDFEINQLKEKFIPKEKT